MLLGHGFGHGFGHGLGHDAATTFVCKLPVVLPGTEHDSFVAILVSDVSVNRMMSSRLAASGRRRDDDIPGKSGNVALLHQR